MTTSDQLYLFSNTDLKHTIMNAMADLFEDTPFDKLTVSKICEKAGVSRSAFYRNFEDKYAVGQWHIRFAHAQGVDEIGRTLSWYDGYLRTEAVFLQHKKFYLGVSDSDGFNSINKSQPRFRQSTLSETITVYRKRKITPHLQFQIDGLIAMELAVLPWWSDRHSYITLEDKCRWMCEMVPRELFNLLNEPLGSHSYR